MLHRRKILKVPLVHCHEKCTCYLVNWKKTASFPESVGSWVPIFGTKVTFFVWLLEQWANHKTAKFWEFLSIILMVPQSIYHHCLSICSFTGESNIIWKESNRIITAGTMIIRKDARLHLENGYNLRIDDLRESDSGEYVCEIETFGSPIHISSRLEILGM